MINEQDFISYLSIKEGAANQTIRHCRIRLGVIKRWLGERELSSDLVEQFFFELKEKGRGNATLNTYLLCFRYLQAYCKDRGLPYVFLNNFKAFPKLRIKPIEIFTQEEVESLLAIDLSYKPFRGKDTSFLNTVYKTFTMSLAYTGARYDEMASLKVMYCDLSGGRITFPATTTKGKEERSVFITEPLVGFLKLLVNGKSRDAFVFQNMMGNKLTSQEYHKDLQKRGEEAGIEHVHPHKFRHTYATHLYIATRDIGLVQVVLGHKDIKSTMIYIKIADDIIRTGMYNHPFVRNHVDVRTTIVAIENYLRILRLDEDRRFDFVKIRETINSFISGLHLSIK